MRGTWLILGVMVMGGCGCHEVGIVGDAGQVVWSDSPMDPGLDGWPGDPFETDTTSDPGADVVTDPEDDHGSSCGSVLGEAHYCYTIMEGDVAVIGLDSGLVCPLGTPFTFLGERTCSHSMGQAGRFLYVCGCEDSPGVSRLDLEAGTSECVEMELEFEDLAALTSWGPGLLVSSGSMSISPLAHYESWDAVVSGDSSPLFVSLWATRMTQHDDRLYAAWHSTSEVEVYHLIHRLQEGTIELEEEITFVAGLSVTDDGLLVMMDGALSYEPGILVFDVANGEKLDEFPLDPGLGARGLSCQTN